MKVKIQFENNMITRMKAGEYENHFINETERLNRSQNEMIL